MKFWNKLLIIFSLFFITFCSYFLYMELTSRIEKTGGDSIGTITFKKRSASRRYTDNVIWEDIDQESEIFNYDAIRTMEYSSAVIALNDGTKIELDQDTLLVVVLSDNGLNINFDKGGVSAKSGAGAVNPIIFNSKDATIALDKGAISLNSSDAGMNIKVSSGTAKIAFEGKELQISTDELATLKNGIAESKKISVFPVFPGHNSNLISFGKTLNVNFLWKSEPPSEVRLEISYSSDFKNILKSRKTSNAGLDVNLPAGEYYWRVVKENSASYPLKFSILSDIKPRLIAPYNNQKVSVTEGSDMVSFRWEKSKYASAYELVAARDIQMSDIVLTLISKVNLISAAGLKSGSYYWTVKSVYPAGIDPGFVLSGPELFELEKIDFSNAKPVPLDHGPVTTALSFNLCWKGVQGAQSYKVEISSDKEFNNIVTTKNTVNSLIRIDQKLSEGNFFWRVSALLGEKISATSVTAILSLIKPADIILVNPSSGAVLINKPGTVRFSWLDPNRGDRYLVEIADNRNFKNIQYRLESTTSGAEFETPGQGDYFWRVFLKDTSGNIIAYSGAGEFIIPGELKTPVQITPENNEKIIPGFKKKIRFEWSKSAGADEYEVQIFHRVAGTEKPLIIFSSKLNYIDMVNQSVLAPGDYSWLVRAKQVRKGRVAAYKESGYSFFAVGEIFLLPAPVVNSPGVIYK